MQPHVYVHILVWNDRRYLPDLFASLDEQTYPNMTVRLLDNGSTDGTKEYLRDHRSQLLVATNTKNAGFAEGHNQLIRFTLDRLADEGDDSLILIVNADMILHKNCIAELVKAYQKTDGKVALQPKIYRAFGENMGDEILEETVKSEILDSTGLRVEKSWRMSDRSAGELDQGQYDQQTDIFAPSGTMALYPVAMVRDVMMNGELFDKDFFAYREDCDLAWRLRKMGYRGLFVPEATVHHYRGMYGAEKQSWWQRLNNRKSQSKFFAALSTRNQLFVLLKNATLFDLLRYSPWILFNETGRVLYGLLFEPQTRKRLLTAGPYLRKMWRKRKQILANARVPESAIRDYVS